MWTLHSCIMIPSFERSPVPDVYVIVMNMYELNTTDLILQSESIMITDYSNIIKTKMEKEQCNLQL